MRPLLPLLLFLGPPFWEAKPPERWTDAEIDFVLHRSPWTQALSPSPEVPIWLATAAPIEDAEAEARLRTKRTEKEPDPDYTGYVTEHGDEVFVLALAYPTLKGLGNAAEDRRMEEESVMKIGRKTWHIVGHFPPTPSDPVLRLVFPREVKPTDKDVEFVLYLPGLPFPEREAVFRVKDLLYHGKPAM
ncbi:MAG TPA: hypothetical protein VKB88_01555 [Bryobacteraceae bacterium]|nr:hypothetical protein [Bryobacteraceae bacterium]